MAELQPNDAFQDRGLIKITDGKFIADITSDGELKTTNKSLKETSGGFSFVKTRDDDSIQVLKDIVIQLRLNNDYLSRVIGEVLQIKDLPKE